MDYAYGYVERRKRYYDGHGRESMTIVVRSNRVDQLISFSTLRNFKLMTHHLTFSLLTKHIFLFQSKSMSHTFELLKMRVKSHFNLSISLLRFIRSAPVKR